MLKIVLQLLKLFFVLTISLLVISFFHEAFYNFNFVAYGNVDRIIFCSINIALLVILGFHLLRSTNRNLNDIDRFNSDFLFYRNKRNDSWSLGRLQD